MVDYRFLNFDSREELGRSLEKGPANRFLRQRGWSTEYVGDHCAEYDYEIWQHDDSPTRMVEVKYTDRVTFTMKPHQFDYLHNSPWGMILVGKGPPSGMTQRKLVTSPELITWYMGYANKIEAAHITRRIWDDGKPGYILPIYVLRCVGSVHRRAAVS